MSDKIAAIIMAAGKGTRMKSSLSKVMHKVAGKPMVNHMIDICENAGVRKIIAIVADGMDDVKQAVVPHSTAIQEQQLGTGDAVKAARNALKDFDGYVLILNGDAPLFNPETLKGLVDAAKNNGMAILGFDAYDPHGYGRLITEGDYVTQIIEQKDCDDRQVELSLCNAGAYCVHAKHLFPFLDEITNDNAQGEYYITDLVAIAARHDVRCAYTIADEEETLGVNSRVQLAQVEYVMQDRLRTRAMDAGVTMIDPQSVYLSMDTQFGTDVVIEPNVFIGAGVSVGHNTVIHAFSHIEGATIGENAEVGPYARIRPKSKIGDGAIVGNFIEVNRSELQAGAKSKHVSYLGDVVVGSKSNIGAGTIVANYDGFDKHKSVFGKDVFIGSNSTIIAPMNIADGAIVAAGSVITEDIDRDSLAIARTRQMNIEGWARVYKDRKSKGK